MLLGLLTQLHYLFELGVVEGMADYQEDMLDSKPLGPCRWDPNPPLPLAHPGPQIWAQCWE